MKITKRDRQAVECAMGDCLQRARELYGHAGLQADNLRLLIKFDLRGKAAGQARARRVAGGYLYEVRINPEALKIAREDTLRDTVPHEIAHVVAHVLGHGFNHGAHWKAICVALGGSGKRCHSLPLTPARRVRRYKYRATCGTVVELTAQRVRRLEQGARYTVTRTGGVITAACRLED